MQGRVLLAALVGLLIVPPGADAARGRADLRVPTIRAAPAGVVAGGTVVASTTVRNAGRRRAPATTVAWYLSRDAVRSPRDVRLAPRARVLALGPRRRATVRRTLAVPRTFPVGRFRLLACADNSLRVRERSESNNCRAAARALQELARPTAGSPPPVSTLPAPGVPAPIVASSTTGSSTDPSSPAPAPEPPGPEPPGPEPPGPEPPDPDPPASDPPVATAGAATTAEDTPVILTLRGGDPDTCELVFAVTAPAPAHGTLGPITATPCGAGGDSATVAYTPAANYSGPDELRFTVSDGTTTSPAATIAITVSAVNDPPVNTLPGALTAPRDGSVALTGLAVSDPDAGTSPLEVTLTATDGTVTLGGTDGLTFTQGNGSTHAEMTFTGTIAAINTALGGATFTPTPGFTGAATLTIETSDQGATGSGDPLTDTDTLDITVSPNQPPDLSAPSSTLSYPGNGAAVEIAPKLSLSDPDDTELVGATVQISSGYQAGADVLELASAPAGSTASWDPDTGTLTLTGTAAIDTYRTALQQVTYRNTSEAPVPGMRTVTFTASDGDAQGATTRNISVT